MKKRIGALVITLALVLSGTALAHSGRTDGSGGHKDNKNASGLGSYHYHCGGYGPHLHNGGVCPYSPSTRSSATKAPSRQTKVTPAPTARPTVPPYLVEGVLQYGKTKVKDVNVRARASKKSERVRSIAKKGTAFQVLDELVGEDDLPWYRVWIDGKEGYIQGSLVDLIDKDEFENAA